MLKRTMTITTTLLAAVVGILAMTATPAPATMFVSFHADSTSFEYDEPTKYMQIKASSSTILTIATADDSAPSTLLDSVVFNSGVDPTDFVLTLTWANVAGTWVGTGQVAFKDTTGATKMEATVTTTWADYAKVAFVGVFQMTGYLQPLGANTSILLTATDPWVYTGNGPGSVGSDSTVSQPNSATYQGGLLFNFSISQEFVGTDLTGFLGANQSAASVGDAAFAVIPVPPALLLGLVGLGILGWRMRRYA